MICIMQLLRDLFLSAEAGHDAEGGPVTGTGAAGATVNKCGHRRNRPYEVIFQDQGDRHQSSWGVGRLEKRLIGLQSHSCNYRVSPLIIKANSF